MAIRVYPGCKNPTHELSLSDGVRKYGLRLLEGDISLQEIPMTSSTIHIAGGTSKFGNWEPGLAELEQRTWLGGRALSDFSLDPTRFLDSHMAFTMVEGKIFPTPQWKLATGVREDYKHMPGDMDWLALHGDADALYISADFTVGGAAFDPQKVYVWLRRIGSPGSLTKIIKTDSGGSPDALVASASGTIDTDDVEDVGSVWISVDVSASGNLTASTKYHVVVYGASTDNASNHWEVGIDKSGTGSKYSANGSSWTAAQYTLYHRVVGTALDRRWYFFEFRGAQYKVDSKVNGDASEIFINGDRGKATSATATVLTDTNKTFTADEFIGAWVKITGGTGKGQYREITDNATNSLTTAAWDITPDNTSLYVIYSTEIWTDITPGANGDEFDVPVTGQPIVVEAAVYFPRGDAVDVYKMQWNEGAAPPAHEFRDDTGDKADLVYGFTDQTNEYQLYIAENTTMTVKRFTPVAYAANLAGGTATNVGDDGAEIINMHDYNGTLYVFKEDGLYQISSDKALREDTGLDFIKSNNTGEAVCNRNFFMYFSWGGFSLQQLQKNAAMIDMASVGPDRGDGLPNDRTGRISAIGFHPAGLFAAVDGGSDNYSSVLVRTDPVGWHEVFRAPETGQRIRAIYWQDCPGTRPRLWMDLGDDVVYQEWPKSGFNPLKDSGVNYQHECAVTLADFDMGATMLPKFFKELSLISENLTTGIEVSMEYQKDSDIGTSLWIPTGTFYSSPADELPINVGNVRKIRVRLRLLTNDADVPPVVVATVLKGSARTPVKYQLRMRIMVGHTQRDLTGTNKDHDPDEILDWLKDAAGNSKGMFLRSIWKQLDEIYMLVEPPTIMREYTNKVLGFWGGSVEITLREA